MNDAQTLCLECEADLPTSGTELIGEIVACPECNAELEVVSTEPFSVELAPEVEEDWGE